jgi:DNA-binding NarL/FixJ family response regulator
VKTHVSNVLHKLGLTGRTQIVTAFHERADHPRPS